MDGVDVAEGLVGSVLVIGFGRFGQIASQALLARNVNVSIIDNDTDMIRAAAGFGFKVYYGDGKRLDVLHASGAGKVRAIAVCVDKPEDALKITELVRARVPAGPAAGARLRPRPCAQAARHRRRLPGPRDAGIGAACSAKRRCWRSTSTRPRPPRPSPTSAGATPNA